MIFTTWILAAALATSGDPIDPRFAPFLADGCVDGPPVPASKSDEGKQIDEFPRLLDMPMSGQSLRFFIAPDSYRGDGLLMVQIDSGLRRSLGAGGRPFFLAVVGNWQRTCTVRVSFDACPQAVEVLEHLKQLHIPVGYGFDELDRITLHATGYTLQFSGYGRVNTLSYSVPGNPLEKPLERAKETLRQCWEPVFKAASSKPSD